MTVKTATGKKREALLKQREESDAAREEDANRTHCKECGDPRAIGRSTIGLCANCFVRMRNGR